MNRILQEALAGAPDVSVLELAEMPARVVDGPKLGTAKPKWRKISTAKLNGPTN